MSAAVNWCTLTPNCAATHSTKAVFPQPGGPCRSRPLGHCNPKAVPSALYSNGQPVTNNLVLKVCIGCQSFDTGQRQSCLYRAAPQLPIVQGSGRPDVWAAHGGHAFNMMLRMAPKPMRVLRQPTECIGHFCCLYRLELLLKGMKSNIDSSDKQRSKLLCFGL